MIKCKVRRYGKDRLIVEIPKSIQDNFKPGDSCEVIVYD